MSDEMFVGAGMVAELEHLQRAENARLAAMTPEERGRDAVAALRRMAAIEPGLRYLFPDMPADDLAV